VAMKVAVGSCTSPGRVRTTNQDSLGDFDSPDSGPDKGRLFVLADGMGGEAGGEIASRLAVDVVGKTYFECPSTEPAAALELSVTAANQAIHAQATASAELHRMGTTCTALVLRGSRAWVAHVGDSRAYRIRDGATERLTTDHSMADRGPAYSHILTRALGVQPEVQVDITLVSAPVRAGDVFLLCSDGLWGQVSDPDVGDIVKSEPDPEVGSRRMVDLANARGGPDNISALLVRVERVDHESWLHAAAHIVGRARSIWRGLAAPKR
jgi:serine/threonine protein phosphatase PrpC